ncbi:MAG: helix-hairpin-helix domain-containing protein [Cyclobacteriaceae bacterium]|nr:helix-hairpin-helix domain-containing protein [Cyclobacteriaceae bacterium]
MRKLLFLSVSMLLPSLMTAQTLPRKDFDLQILIDEIVAVQDDDLNYEELYENLVQLLSNPADLNLITAEQLRSLYILNESQIQSLINYREETGRFISVFELQAIQGFSKETFQRLTQFVTVIDPAIGINRSLLNRILNEKNNYLLLRYDRTLEEKKGYREETSPGSRYAGSPDRLYTRFRTSRPGDFSVGFTAEKDAGETLSWNPNKKQYGADFLSFHAQVLNKGLIKNLIVGDFQAQFGQGLILGSAFGIGKNAEAITTIRRANIGFMPYTSLYEAGYFRGGALSYSVTNRITLHSMFSSRWRDGNAVQDSTFEFSSVSSLTYTGLHRTQSEIEKRSTLHEQNMAGVFNYRYKSIDAGAIIHRTLFNLPLKRTPTLYNQYYFQGKQNTNVSLFLNYTYRNFAFFSEAAKTIGEGMGVTAGIMGSLTPSFDVSLYFRKYDRDFQTFYSNALSESSTPQNESGIYWGWKYQLNKKYSFSGYFDLFKFSWLRYRSYTPSQGNEWLFRFNYKPSKNVYMFIQAREESKVRNLSTDTNLYLTAQGVKRNYWINVDYVITNHLSFKTRAQFSSYRFGDSTTGGMVILQDVTWALGKISISGRYALFDTDDYDNRLYVYERDVWLAFSFPAYYGVGIRNYLLLQYSVSKKVDLWFRWAHVRYTDRDIIGSGSEAIDGNTRNDLKLQARIRL